MEAKANKKGVIVMINQHFASLFNIFDLFLNSIISSMVSSIFNINNITVNKNVKSIGEYHIKIGKYGPYILYNGKFYKIKSEYVPENLTEEDCVKIIGENNINTTSKPVKKTSIKKTVKK